MVDFIRIPPDSTGKRLQTKQWTVDGEQVHVQKMHITCGADAASELTIDERGAAFTRFTEGDPIFGGFNDLKVTNAYLSGAYEFSNGSADELYFSEELNGGTVVYDSTSSSIILITTGSNGSLASRVTNRYHFYQQGMSMLVMMSIACGDSGKEFNVRRWGAFNTNNGSFFELTENGLAVVVRGDTRGYLNEIKVSQDSWNVDKLDGTGISGLTLDVTKINMYWVDIAWPNTSVRFGVFSGEGKRLVCHAFDCANETNIPSLKRGAAPVKVENINTGSAGSGSEIRFIAASIFNEGEPNYSFWRYSGMGCFNKAVTTNTPLFACRAKRVLDNGLKNTINTYPESLSIASIGGPVKIDLIWHYDLLTGADWIPVYDSTMEYDNSSTSIDSTSSEYWLTKTYYCSEGVVNIDLTPIFELYDEGIALGGDGLTQLVLSFVVTKFNAEDTVSVSADLGVRELW